MSKGDLKLMMKSHWLLLVSANVIHSDGSRGVLCQC